jgi:hypothetical protein
VKASVSRVISGCSPPRPIDVGRCQVDPALDLGHQRAPAFCVLGTGIAHGSTTRVEQQLCSFGPYVVPGCWIRPAPWHDAAKMLVRSSLAARSARGGVMTVDIGYRAVICVSEISRPSHAASSSRS